MTLSINCSIIYLLNKYAHQKREILSAWGERRGILQIMAEVRIKENETLDSALRRFKRSCAKSGVLSELKKRQHYEKPSVKRKKKSEAARKRKY